MIVVNKLDDAVVEDGESTEVLKPDTDTLPTKVKDIMANGVHSEGRSGCGLSRLDTTATKERVPVEDEDDVETREKGGEDVEVLTKSLKGCSIQETQGSEIEDKLSKLTVKDEKSDDDDNNNDDDRETRCASYQSQSSTIAVDPPSLTHEKDDEERENEDDDEVAVAEQDLLDRGPMAGKPTNYHPNTNVGRIAGKQYGVHNLDYYANQVAPLPQQQMSNGYNQMQGGYNFAQQQQQQQQNTYYMTQQQPNMGMSPSNNMNAGYTNAVCSGKRGMDDDEDNPYKFTRPIEEAYVGFNDLSGSGMQQPYASYPQVSQALNCGPGKLEDTNALSPTSDLRPCFDTQFSTSDFDNLNSILEMLGDGSGRAVQQQQQQQQQQQLQQQQQMPQQQTFVDKTQMGNMRDFDQGYASENSPHSDNQGSPGTSPKSTFSPMRPPSNMSGDSGIASPYNEETMSTAVPSPGTEYSQTVHSPYTPQSNTYMSTHSHHDDCSMASAPSPQGDFLASRTEELVDALDVIAKDLQETKKVSNGLQRNGLCSQGGAQSGNYVSQAVTTQGVNNGGQMSVGRQLASNMPPPMRTMPSPPHRNANPNPNPNNSLPCNIPSTVMPQKPAQARDHRPEKLPIPPLTKIQPAVTSSVPVALVVPNTIAVTTATPTTTTSQQVQVLLAQNGQAPAQVVLFLNNQAPVQAPQKTKRFRDIQPRLPDTSPQQPPVSSTNQPAQRNASSPRNDRSATGVVPNVCNVQSVGVGPVAGGGSTSPPRQLQQPVQAQSPNQNGNCGGGNAVPAQPRRIAQARGQQQVQQNKMLTVARRLIASMTTQDLQFQDAEGDTYLHVSVCKADHNMVQALLERLERENLRAMVNRQNCMRQTPLYLAVSSNSPEMVRLLIQYEADVNVFAQHTLADGRTMETTSALHCVASKGAAYLPTLQALLQANPVNINEVNSDGHTALHCAILEHGKANGEGGVVDNLPIIHAMIRQGGADPNALSKKNGKTPLMYALESRDINLIETFVGLIDPASLMTFLRTRAYDETTPLKILENVQRGMDEVARQRLQTCLKVKGRREC